MTPETPHGLVRAIRAALDETERLAEDALGGDMWFDGDKELADHYQRHDPDAVLRRVTADRRVLERHQPRRLPPTHYRPEVVECEHCARMCHSRSGLACDDPTDAPWPCDEIRDLCDRLDINPEESTQ